MGSITQPGGMVIGNPVASATAGSILFAGALGVLAQDNANLFWDNTNKRLGIGTNAPGAKVSIAAGTATTAVSPFTITQTWNNAAVTFPGLTLTITDTASAAGSLAMQILGGAGGATNLLSLSKAGTLTTGSSILAASTCVLNGTTGDIGIRNTSGIIGWNTNSAGGAGDTGLSRISAGLLGIGTGAFGSFAGRLKLTSAIHAAVAIAALNGAPTVGEIQSVNDALAPAAGAPVAAGGAANALIWWNGAQWTVVAI